MNIWYVLALVVLGGSMWFLYAKSRKKKAALRPVSRISSGKYMEDLYERRRALKEHLITLRASRDILEKEINDFSLNMEAHGGEVNSELARLLLERSSLRDLIVSATNEVNKLEKCIGETRRNFLKKASEQVGNRH